MFGPCAGSYICPTARVHATCRPETKPPQTENPFEARRAATDAETIESTSDTSRSAERIDHRLPKHSPSLSEHGGLDVHDDHGSLGRLGAHGVPGVVGLFCVHGVCGARQGVRRSKGVRSLTVRNWADFSQKCPASPDLGRDRPKIDQLRPNSGQLRPKLVKFVRNWSKLLRSVETSARTHPSCRNRPGPSRVCFDLLVGGDLVGELSRSEAANLVQEVSAREFGLRTADQFSPRCWPSRPEPPPHCRRCAWRRIEFWGMAATAPSSRAPSAASRPR